MCYINKLIIKSIVLTTVAFTAVNTGFSQSYYHNPGDTIIANAVFNDISVYNIFQTHTAADTIYFKWYKQSVEIPASWEASICDNGFCNPTLVDSGMMIPIVPGDDGFMSLHINPKSEPGKAIIRYTIFDTLTPLQVDTLTWIITAGSTTGINELLKEQPVVTYNGTAIICTKLMGNYNTVLLYDMNGRLLLRKEISGNETNISLQPYSKGHFVIRLMGRRIFTTRIQKY